MRILSYIAATCSAGVGVGCIAVISHYQMVFETSGMELPLLSQLVVYNSGGVPAVILFALSILIVVLEKMTVMLQ